MKKELGILLVGILIGVGTMLLGIKLTSKDQAIDLNCPEVNCSASKEIIRPNINLSCPEANVSVSCPEPEQNIHLPYNNIQAPYHDITFNLRGDRLCIRDVDEYGRLYGTSMQPTAFTGHTMIQREYKGQELKEGMIIRFKRNGGHTIHTIKGDYSDDGYVLTRGNNNHGHERVKLENVTHIIVGVLFTQDAG